MQLGLAGRCQANTTGHAHMAAGCAVSMADACRVFNCVDNRSFLRSLLSAPRRRTGFLRRPASCQAARAWPHLNGVTCSRPRTRRTPHRLKTAAHWQPSPPSSGTRRPQAALRATIQWRRLASAAACRAWTHVTQVRSVVRPPPSYRPVHRIEPVLSPGLPLACC